MSIEKKSPAPIEYSDQPEFTIKKNPEFSEEQIKAFELMGISKVLLMNEKYKRSKLHTKTTFNHKVRKVVCAVTKPFASLHANTAKNLEHPYRKKAYKLRQKALKLRKKYKDIQPEDKKAEKALKNLIALQIYMENLKDQASMGIFESTSFDITIQEVKKDISRLRTVDSYNILPVLDPGMLPLLDAKGLIGTIPKLKEEKS